ncbi:MAG TPA: glycosyltransferase [Pyrinomonadaceae bacterium]|nr:glycosyltransferase [Pyrinomonadaceae bacterium]
MSRVLIGIYIDSEFKRLRQTLAAVRTHGPAGAEVVLLLDGAGNLPPSMARLVAGLPQLVYAPARGAAACFNRLASFSDAEVVILLESGARPAAQSLQLLIAALDPKTHTGLAGPSTNISWNEQGAFADASGTENGIAATARTAAGQFQQELRTLEPLYSLADFCYAVRREVIDAVGAADERFESGPCWEMDYNIRAARAGWRGVWVGAAYVHRAPFTSRRRFEEGRRFEASKQLYQDKFCGARLRGEKTDYRSHCRGDACANFAPPDLIEIRKRLPIAAAASSTKPALDRNAVAAVFSSDAPLVTCIMPTYNRRGFVSQAVRCFLRQDYPNLELLVIDDGTEPVADCVPESQNIRYLRLDAKMTIGAKRNFACERARGEFIVHWDDDDWYPANRVSRQIDALRDGRYQISGSSRIYYHDAAASRAWEYRYLAKNAAWVGGNTLAYRKSFWTRHRFPDVQIGEDSRFVWSSRAGSICDLADPSLCVATAHQGNTSRKDFKGSYWTAQSPEVLANLLGDDLHFYSLRAQWPLVSCIMPTYNRRAYLPQSLQCFLHQDYPNRELLVIDDGSDAVGDLTGIAENIRYVRVPRRMSIGAKRNLACQQARGEIIAHWDDDDWYAPDRLRYQVAPIIGGLTDFTGLENAFVLELPAGNFWTTDARLHERMFVENVHGGTLVFRKDLWTQGLRYPEVNLAEDAWLLHRATRRGKRLLRLANPGVFVYVRHGTNAWREFRPGSFIDPNGWRRIPRPLHFPDPALSFFLAASR